jgi:hypothetical protein
MKEKIYQRIRTDDELKKKLAELMHITYMSVYSSAVRKAPSLSDYKVVKLIMSHTGLKESEIFDKSKN